MNETTQASMYMILHGLLDQGWVNDRPFRFDSPDGEVRVILDFADEQVEVIRFRAGLITGEATFRGAMISAVYDLLVTG